MLELFAIGLTLVNLCIAVAGTQRYLSVVTTPDLAAGTSAITAIGTGAWIGVIGLWLGWYEFMAIMSALGFFGCVYNYRNVKALAEHVVHVKAETYTKQWNNAKPVYENTRKAETFYPEAKRIN